MDRISGYTVVRAAADLHATIAEDSDGIACGHAKMVTFHATCSAVHAPEGLLGATVDTDATLELSGGTVTADIVGAAIYFNGVDSTFTVDSFTDGTHVEMSAPATATANDITISFVVATPGLAASGATIQVREGNGAWQDAASGLGVTQLGGDGSTGLTLGGVKAILAPSDAKQPFIPWGECRLKTTGHATKLVPGLKVTAAVVFGDVSPLVDVNL